MTGLLQVSPLLLSVRAMLRLGRQENHMRYLPASRSTVRSKQVPREPPRTGFFSYFTHPADVSASAAPLSAAGSTPASRQASTQEATRRHFMTQSCPRGVLRFGSPLDPRVCVQSPAPISGRT